MRNSLSKWNFGKLRATYLPMVKKYSRCVKNVNERFHFVINKKTSSVVNKVVVLLYNDNYWLYIYFIVDLFIQDKDWLFEKAATKMFVQWSLL